MKAKPKNPDLLPSSWSLSISTHIQRPTLNLM
jgi:hypothetical protein